MDFASFHQSLTDSQPPAGLHPLLRAMWYDGRGDWDSSHDIAQDIPGKWGSWVHAYLHRKEGDEWNAGYWYRQAGRPFPHLSLEAEWEEIVQQLLGQYPVQSS
ncbi:hypothetical protein [Pontibacter sp. G13]|uniref:hypothetical protein n=1 Tax=Pontibacter sp. G13 TaxID=3074898 RepID=UPI00288A90C5|nr:hypothetical protein [Pontibacter sp. G13]WNJ21018.1 hypothetical protein RJD25_11155 [Pontibacter sp. G13]